MGRIRDLVGTSVVCGILHRRAAGARRRSDAFAMNNVLAEHCKRNGWLIVDKWTRFYGKNHLYARGCVHLSPQGIGVLARRLESEIRVKVFFLETRKV